MGVPSNNSKRNFILLSILIAIIVFILIPIFIYRSAIEAPSAITKDKEFEIKPGSSISQIANELKSSDLIGSTLFFKVYLKLNKVDKGIQAGQYTIPAKSTIKDLAILFQHGRDDVTIRFIEGWRVEQLGLEVSSKLKNIEYKTFVTDTRKDEGYLFPDTYIVNKDITQADFIDLLKETFLVKTADILTEQNLTKIGLTKNDTVILASLVEREAAQENDRKIIAGILLKRLQEGMKLEVDATTQYAVALRKFCLPKQCQIEGAVCSETQLQTECLQGLDVKLIKGIEWWPKGITADDLSYDSPYNTRKIVGLPPAPISSFSLSSLEAVINHIDSDFYFYITDKNGVTHYGKTLEEHNTNIAKYLN